MNLLKRRKTTFSTTENLRRHVRTPLLDRERNLITEYPTKIHEISKKRRQEEDKIPGNSEYTFVVQLLRLTKVTSNQRNFVKHLKQ